MKIKLRDLSRLLKRPTDNGQRITDNGQRTTRPTQKSPVLVHVVVVALVIA